MPRIPRKEARLVPALPSVSAGQCLARGVGDQLAECRAAECVEMWPGEKKEGLPKELVRYVSLAEGRWLKGAIERDREPQV